MALPDGIRVDDEGNVTFEGRSGQTLLLNVLLRAKFARPFEPATFLNEWMADLIVGLHARFRAALPPQSVQPAAGPLFGDDPAIRDEIAEALVIDAQHSEWWTWPREKQADFVRDIACAPHPVSQETVDEVLLMIHDRVEAARRLVAQADRGGQT
jgi:hypothetical protein